MRRRAQPAWLRLFDIFKDCGSISSGIVGLPQQVVDADLVKIRKADEHLGGDIVFTGFIFGNAPRILIITNTQPELGMDVEKLRKSVFYCVCLPFSQ